MQHTTTIRDKKMAMCDYYLCDVCGQKAFYDSHVQYGECRVAALCEDCEKTHLLILRKRSDPPIDQLTAALSQSALDIQTLKDENEVLRGQVPKWISAKDRLPITQADMEGKNYELIEGLFVLTGSNGITRSDFAAGNTIGYWGKFHYERDVVTHWLEVSIPALHAEEVKP